MRHSLSVLAVAALAAGLAGGPAAPARAAAMDPFLEQQQTEQSLNVAIRLYREGKIDEAETAVRGFLRLQPDSAKAHEILGAVLGQQGRNEEAMEALETALKLNPNLATAHANRAVLLMAEGKVQAARRALEQAVELRPDLVPAQERLGRLYEALGRRDDAIHAYEMAIEHQQNVTEPGVRINLGALYNARGEHDRTVSMLTTWQRDRDVPADLHIVLADAMLGQGRVEIARRQYEFILPEHPDNVLLRLGYGVTLRAAGEHQEALEEFRAVAEDRPELAAPLAQIGETWLAMDEPQKARDAFLQAMEMADNPESLEYRYALVLRRSGDAAGAIGVYEDMIARQGPSLRALTALASAQIAADRPEAARATLEQAAAEFPDDPAGFVRLALFLRENGALDDALAVAEKGLIEHPDHVPLLRIAATVARDTDDMQTAVRYGERILERNPDSIEDRFIFATLLDKARQDTGAERLYRDVADRQPDNWAAMNNLALVLTRNDKAQEALNYARRASQIQPENPAVKHTLAWVLYNVGSLGEAQRLMEEALDALPDVGEIRYHYGHILRARGRTAEAKEQFEKGLEIDPEHDQAPKVRDLLQQM
ncbi:MAG: tetratricopeptide repeat protein [Pseudomonadota bacterium]